MRRECRERFPRHRLQRKPLVSDPGMHHGTCVTHVPWCNSGSLTRDCGENVPGIPGACATRNFTYLVRGPCEVEGKLNKHYLVNFVFVFNTENYIRAWLNCNCHNPYQGPFCVWAQPIRDDVTFWLFHILIPYNIILYFRLPYFHVSNSALCST